MIRAAVQAEPIDLAAEIALVEGIGAGAITTFSGHVRADDGVTALELEHYPGMTDAALAGLAAEAQRRWSLTAVTVVHRVGRMSVGERIVLVITAAPHRSDALSACTALIDQLKTQAPFWKRETRGNEQRWVEHRATDEAAARRWD